MHGSPPSYPIRAALGLVAALAIGAGVVAICNTVWALSRGFPLSQLWNEASPTQIIIAALPYALLAILGISAWRVWLAGLCATLALWGYYLWDILHFTGGGANIGLGILMLFSPILITGVCLLTLAALAKRRPQREIAAGHGSR